MMRRPPTPDRRTMDHSRHSNADQPIDLTHMDAVPLPNTTTTATAAHPRQSQQPSSAGSGVVVTTSSTTDDSDSYVPESLADFVAEANGRLEALQMDFMNSIKQDDSMNHAAVLLLSPDPTSADWKSPPPPEFHGMTDSQIKASIFGDNNDQYYDEDHDGYIHEDDHCHQLGVRSPPPSLPPLYDSDANLESFASQPQQPLPATHQLSPPPDFASTRMIQQMMMTQTTTTTPPQTTLFQQQTPTQRIHSNTAITPQQQQQQHFIVERSNESKMLSNIHFVATTTDQPAAKHHHPRQDNDHVFVLPNENHRTSAAPSSFFRSPDKYTSQPSSSLHDEVLHTSLEGDGMHSEALSPGEEQILVSLTSPFQSYESDFRTYSNEWKHSNDLVEREEDKEQPNPPSKKSNPVITTTATTLISDQHHGHDTGTRPIQPPPQQRHHPIVVDVNVVDDDDRHVMTASSSPTATDAAEVQDDDVTDGITEMPSVTTTGVVTDGAAIVENNYQEEEEERGRNVIGATQQKQQPVVPAPLILPLNSEEDEMQDSVMTPSPLSMGSPKAAATSSSSRVFTIQQQPLSPPSLSPTPLSPASTSARSAKLHALITAATEQQFEVEIIPNKQEEVESNQAEENHKTVQSQENNKNLNHSKKETSKSLKSSTERRKTKASQAKTPATVRSKDRNRLASAKCQSSQGNKPKMQTPERQTSDKKPKQPTPSSASSSSPPLLLKAQKNRSSIKLFTAETAHRLSRSKETAASAKKSSPDNTPADLSKKRKPKQQQTESSDKQQIETRMFSTESADRLHKAKLQGSKDRARSRSASPVVKARNVTPTQRPKTATRPRESAPSSFANVSSPEPLPRRVHATSAATTSASMDRLLRPTESWVHHAQKDKPFSSSSSLTPRTNQHKGAAASSSSIERLLRPTEAWTHAHEKKCKDDEEAQSHSEVIVPPPSKKITQQTVERLCKPTVSSAAMASPASARRIPGLPHTIFMEKKLVPASLSLNDSIDNEQVVFPSNISNPPSPIAPSSHLLMPTVTSATKKREKRKSVIPPSHSTKKVSGASSRLLSATAASKARTLAASETIRTSNSQTRAVRPRPQPRKHDPSTTTETENLSPQGEETEKPRGKDQNRQPQAAEEQKERRVLTVPKSPKLATKARHGKLSTAERKADVSLALCNEVFGKALRDDSTSVGSHTSRGSLTIPTEPKLATSLRYGTRDRHSMLYIRNPATDVSLAQSTEVMMRELRGSYHPLAVAKKRDGLTIPKAPKFSEIKKRELPKSTAEKEEEEMDYFKAHAFKANPILIPSNQPRVPNNRRATMPAQFTQTQHGRTPEEDDIVRKASKSTRRVSRYLQPTASHASKVKSVTPKISTTNHKSVKEPRRKKVNTDEQGLRVFKARPPQITTYHPDTPPSTTSSKSPSSTTPSRPFSLATSSRPKSRDAVREASRQRIEEMARQRDTQASQRRLMEERITKQRYAEQRKMEDAQRHQQLHQLQPHEIPKHKKTTTAQPFHLTSLSRHEIAMRELQERLEAEEEERRRQATSFRAKPVPKTTYVPKKISPRSSEEALTDPFSPELQSKGRAVSRREFDEYAERQRQIAEAQLQEIEARRRAEEEAEIQELRRLPVKEGGLIPTAEPINAVFWKD